ncbi:MAG: hypothetical protein IID03_12935 [Candidatus Dadabacteria bacterium]|nr:hypothetical protein [Candidatus Dadabacteria bacterium]
MTDKKLTEPLEPLMLLEDEPVPDFSVDELQTGVFARTVAGAAVGTRGPFTIGVFADWGLGKTSILNQAKSLIENDPNYNNVVTVWFNAWQYEKEEHPIIPLIASIVREAKSKEEVVSRTLKKTYSELSRTLRSIAYGFSVKGKAGVPGFGEIGFGFVAKDMIARYTSLRSEEGPLIARSFYYDAFENLRKIQESIKSDTNNKSLPKIIVFIDDLDRCFPDKGLMLLESIKLVLAQKGFVFVMAVDRRMIERYVEKRYRDEFNVSDYSTSGTSYLDKIVQLPLYIPPHENRFEKYIKELLNRPAINEDDRKSLQYLIKPLALGSNSNPRSMVRLINNLLVDKYMYKKIYKTEIERVIPESEFLQYSAVSRILQQHLEYQLYSHLVKDDPLCKELASDTDKSIFADSILDKKKQISLSDSRRQKILELLESKDFLLELLREPNTGLKWLENKDKRIQVDSFLTMQRPVDIETDIPKSQKSIIDNAIRSSLGLSSGMEPTPEDLKKLSTLNLSLSNITDEGLKHISGLTSLQNLSLGGNQITDEGLKFIQTKLPACSIY